MVLPKGKTLTLYGAVLAVGLVVAGLFVAPTLFASEKPEHSEYRAHLDHSSFFTKPIVSPQDVTKACLQCHKQSAKDVMATAHWNWVGEPVEVPNHPGKRQIGKKNLLNNYCIGITGNWPSCTKCHAGYGWEDESFDFNKETNVDCLVCHDWSGGYIKGKAGMPDKSVDLQASAQSVGYPKRDNCGSCHFFGGGGMGVKHGDLHVALNTPDMEADIHMGGNDMLCVDCHKAPKHAISGRSIAVSVDSRNGIDCTTCHKGEIHTDKRIQSHLKRVACQTCHIPTHAVRAPTKMDWDWSKAGDPSRKEDPHEYLKIKGEFIYGQSVVPEYRWFNHTADRYLVGDKIDPEGTTILNNPRGSRKDAHAQIHPFKVHRGKQPYDAGNRYLIPPVTAGEGGYWHVFDWDQAMRLGAKSVGLEYSGNYAFAKTEMYWPLNHTVRPKEEALDCADCHGQKASRMDWKALGYDQDPILAGGR